jgi:hypothetical protein
VKAKNRHPGSGILLFSLALAVLSVSCSRDTKEGLGSGNVYVSIFQPNQRLSFDQIVVEVSLSRRSTRQVSKSGLDANQASNGISHVESCSKNPVVTSPNRAYIAGCTGDYSPYRNADVFWVRNPATGDTPFRSKLSHNRVCAFVWSVNSDSIVVLTSSTHVSINPKYWFYALSGHPKQYENYRLEVVTLRSHSHRGIDLPYETSAGFGEITGWSQM